MLNPLESSRITLKKTLVIRGKTNLLKYYQALKHNQLRTKKANGRIRKQRKIGSSETKDIKRKVRAEVILISI